MPFPWTHSVFQRHQRRQFKSRWSALPDSLRKQQRLKVNVWSLLAACFDFLLDQWLIWWKQFCSGGFCSCVRVCVFRQCRREIEDHIIGLIQQQSNGQEASAVHPQPQVQSSGPAFLGHKLRSIFNAIHSGLFFFLALSFYTKYLQNILLSCYWQVFFMYSISPSGPRLC